MLILQTIKNAHILGFTDEAGYMNLIDTRMKLKPSATHQENAGFWKKNLFTLIVLNMPHCNELIWWAEELNFYVLMMNTEKAIVSSWVTHDNSVYDFCWIKVNPLLAVLYISFYLGID